MKKIVCLWLCVLGIGASLSAVSLDASARCVWRNGNRVCVNDGYRHDRGYHRGWRHGHHCRWVGGFWRHGHYIRAHRVCWSR